MSELKADVAAVKVGDVTKVEVVKKAGDVVGVEKRERKREVGKGVNKEETITKKINGGFGMADEKKSEEEKPQISGKCDGS